MPQSSQQAQSIHEQWVPLEEGDAQDKDVPEWELRKKHPITIRPIYVLMKDVSSVHKWYAHDQFKPENQIKKVPSRASEEAVTSKLQQTAKHYPNVDAIKWSKDCPKIYERGKPFAAPTTWNEKVPWLVLACSTNEHKPRTSMLSHRHIWKPSQENYLWLQWHADMLSPQSNGNESNSHVVPVSPCPPDMIWM